jgi:hypothetical protein
MKMPETNNSVEKGNKTIKIAVHFWTSVSPKERTEGLALPKKTCWDSGYVSVPSNNLHGIRAGVGKNFKNIEELPGIIKELLEKSDIDVRRSDKDKEYKEALRMMKESKLSLK